MLRYTTRDIITRAQELADLKNSDFISWGENMRLLDESYKKLYSQIIAANDKYYFVKISLKDLTKVIVPEEREQNVVYFKLPSDFYQLASIYLKQSNKPVVKKAVSESVTCDRYDIIKDMLVLYGTLSQKDIVINYYPIPKTLTLKNTETVLDLTNVIDCNGSKYLKAIVGTGTTEIVIEDVSSCTIKTFTVSAEITGGTLGKGFAYVWNATDSWMISFYDGSVVHEDELFGSFKSNGNLRLYKIVDDKVVYGKEEDKFATEINTEIILPDNYSYITANDDGSEFFAVAEGKLYSCDESGNKEITDADEEKIEWFIPGLYYVQNGSIMCGENVLETYGNYNKVLGYNKIDFNTGYGVSVTSFDDDKVHLKSCFVDTALDFPNNFYFSYLAYQLAIAYKIKQNADSTGLQALLGEETQQFFDTLSRDAAEYHRINNVYGNGGFYG